MEERQPCLSAYSSQTRIQMPNKINEIYHVDFIGYFISI